jgi:hypothetical protein
VIGDSGAIGEPIGYAVERYCCYLKLMQSSISTRSSPRLNFFGLLVVSCSGNVLARALPGTA